jgi:hypothetical protein
MFCHQNPLAQLFMFLPAINITTPPVAERHNITNIFCNYVVVLSYTIRPVRNVSFSELAAVPGKIAHLSVNSQRNVTSI